MKQQNYLVRNGFLLKELVIKGIRLKYRRSYFGILWSLIEPILSTAVMVVIFGTLFNNKSPLFPLYVMVGRLWFSFYQDGTRNAMKAIRNNAGMIKKVYVPKFLYPLSTVIFCFIIFLISLVVLVGLFFICKAQPSWHLLEIIPSLILLFFLTLGCGTILCSMNVFFRDIEYIWNVLCMILMYMSAIFYYPETILASRFAWVLKINPLFHIITMARNAIMGGTMSLNSILYTCAFTAGTLLVGGLLFYKTKDRFIFHL